MTYEYVSSKVASKFCVFATSYSLDLYNQQSYVGRSRDTYQFYRDRDHPAV